MMRILLTGASGFVGRRVLDQFAGSDSLKVRCVYRQLPESSTPGVELCQISGLTSETDWTSALADVSVVVHCAARVHVMREQATDPLQAFRQVNVDGTLRLARQAAEAGVRRFIYLSSVKVNGEETTPGRPFTADDRPEPQDPYGISKFEAEQGLLSLARDTGLEVVFIRPTLVYGPGVKANFLRMMRWLRRGIPLPLGAIDNRRSLVALDNLVDLIRVCLDHPAAANECFLVSDGRDVSTSELIRMLGQALGVPARLLPIPPIFIKLAALMLRRDDFSRRLVGSLQVDIGKTRQLLGWAPPVSTREGLAKTAEHFLESES